MRSSSSSSFPEVVVALAHHGGQVGVPAHQRQRLARRHVEVAGHLVQAEGAVHAARVRGLVGVFAPRGGTGNYLRCGNENCNEGTAAALLFIPQIAPRRLTWQRGFCEWFLIFIMSLILMRRTKKALRSTGLGRIFCNKGQPED